MPLYDYVCNRCGKEFEQVAKIADREATKCSCGGSCRILISSTRRDWFRPGYWRDFAETPIYVESKRHLKDLCKKYGVYSRALD